MLCLCIAVVSIQIYLKLKRLINHGLIDAGVLDIYPGTYHQKHQTLSGELNKCKWNFKSLNKHGIIVADVSNIEPQKHWTA